jgi:hypothetical protein
VTVNLSKAYQEYLGVGQMTDETMTIPANADKKWEAVHSLAKRIVSDAIELNGHRLSFDEAFRLNTWATNLALSLLGWQQV